MELSKRTRNWTSAETDLGAIHAIGNGRMCVYGQGPAIYQVFGPPYSTPALLGATLDGAGLSCESNRIRRSAFWVHRLREAGGEPVGELTDFMAPDLPCFVRRLSLERPLTITLAFDKVVKLIENGPRLRSRTGAADLAWAAGAMIPSGTYVYHNFPLPRHHFWQVAVRGDVAILRDDADPTRIHMSFPPGDSALMVVGGPTYADATTNAEHALRADMNDMLQRGLATWGEFCDALIDVPEIPARENGELEEIPDADEVIENVAILIKSQQGADGGVFAGHYYHLGYVRDQYGVFRGLLAMGCHREARAIIERFRIVFQEMGRVNNAHGIELEGISHVHENDDVEITGYLLVQAFDYADRAGDPAIIDEVFPMLEWAWEAQTRWLIEGMLPFNGDETYVAGGVLPRYTLNDGSAEATLLFIFGGGKLLDWVERNGKWDAARLAEARATLEAVRARYAANFIVDGRLATNNPARARAAEMPRFRHGVCEETITFGWTERNANGRYVSPEAINHEPPLAAVPPRQFFLRSVSLTPIWLNCDLVPRELVERDAEQIAREFAATGKMPSSPDGDVTVGYDYGLLLYVLAEMRHPLAPLVAERMLAALDQTGAWVEYYRGGVQAGCRCRPWESAISIDGLLHYLARMT